VQALAALAQAESSDIVARAYGGASTSFGSEYIIPRPFDPRLLVQLAPAVAKAAMDSGVATRPITDFAAYRQQLSEFVFRSGLAMKPVFEQARAAPKRVIYAEGEDERVLRAAQVLLTEGLAKPILIGRPEIIERRVAQLGLSFRPGSDAEIVNPASDPRYADYVAFYHGLMERKGVSLDLARTLVRTNSTVIAALAVRKGDADAMICGTIGRFHMHLQMIDDIVGRKANVGDIYALSLLIVPGGTLFMCDTYVNEELDAAQLCELTLLAAEEVRRFGIEPKVALLSNSSFGSRETGSAGKMQQALRLIQARAPDLEVEGEMHADAALSAEIRQRLFPNSRLKGSANLLIMPSLDAANISFNLLKEGGNGLAVGPILLGAARACHILTPSVTARGIVNMSAVAVVDAANAAAVDAGTIAGQTP
ncbi:MAG: phosphate acyltransferase, partial [Rhodospirillales bacterium]